jgi:tRNA-2-methylthio-N6-dimethylallyladenosine synthase
MLIGMLGCMAETTEVEITGRRKLVDMVVGPDAYRSPLGWI